MTKAKAAALPLLATKLHAPTRRSNLVHRDRLNDRFTRSPHRPKLTLISAPAGFGKTTLLTEWFGTTDGASTTTAWVALDAGDDDATSFGAYVVAALQMVAPNVGGDAGVLLQSSPSLQAVFAALINELEKVAGEVALVLDDYHVITTAEIHEAISYLVDHAPQQFHLVLASRSDPPLPLARLRARGELLEVRASDLRFTSAEAASYFNEAMNLGLGATDVSALEARTEGWIAALQLAALSLQGRNDVAGFIANFTGNDRFVVDYLAEEVLERQPVDVREFLLQTAVLERLEGSLCDAVTASAGGKAMLEALDRANLFVVPLDDRRRWYRYHHLFADVLRARLSDEHPERVRELHARASEWFEANGDPAAAIAHAMAGEHFERAARLIELARPAMVQARQEATLRRWLEALPVELFDERPVLTIGLVGARMATGDPTGVEVLVDKVERWLHNPSPAPIVFDHDEFPRLPAMVAMYRAGLALLAGDTAATITHASRVIELADPTDHLRQGAANALLGLAHWSLGDLAEASSRYSAARD